MSKQVTDDLPGKDKNQQEVDEAQIKKDLIAQHEADQVKKTNFPTEVVDLPSKGILYPKDQPLSNGSIEMKYMTAKEEDILASPKLIKQGVVIDKLLESMIVTPIDYNDLLLGDKNAIMIAARILGYGKEYEVKAKCQKCGHVNESVIDLTTVDDKNIDEELVQESVNQFEYTLPKTQRSIQFRLLTHGIQKQISEELKGLKKISNKTGVNKELTTRLKHIITEVDGNSTPKAIRNFVDNELFAYDSRELRNYIRKIQPDVNLSYAFECDECAHENNDIDIDIDVDFFWPGA